MLKRGNTKIHLWGRSMGAATSIMFSKHSNSVPIVHKADIKHRILRTGLALQQPMESNQIVREFAYQDPRVHPGARHVVHAQENPKIA